MSLNKEGAFFLGLKVGRRSLDLVITDFTGAIRARINKRHSYPSPAAVIEFTHMAIERLLNNLTNEERDRVAGLGIAIPFRLWEWAKALGLDPKDMEDWKTEDWKTHKEGDARTVKEEPENMLEHNWISTTCCIKETSSKIFIFQ